MQDSTSRFDDPFADLFGKLPDPRSRGHEAPGPRRTPASETEDVADVSARSTVDASAEDATASATPAPLTGGAAAASMAASPISRRAAREAMRAQAPEPAAPHEQPPATVVQPTAVPPAAMPTAASAPTPQAPPQRATAGFGDVGAPAAAVPETRTAVLTGPVPNAEPEDAPGLASLEDLFMGNRSSDEIGDVPPPPNRRRRRIGGWIALGIVLLFFGGIAAGALYVWTTYEAPIREFMGWEEPKDYEEGLATGEALLTISSGDTGGTISQSLYDAGVTKTPEAFYDMLVDTGQNPTFYPGVYRLQQKMTSAAALTALQDPASKLENSALLREGLTVDQTIQSLAEGVGLPIEDFQAAIADPSVYGVQADSLEGWLFPAMYTFDPGVTAADVIQTMVDRTAESLDAAGVPVEDRQRVLIVASIIQREARFESDFYKVSRVIQNRLDPSNQQTYGLLQMDSTAQYGYGEMHDGTVSSSQEALEDDNLWNTYVHPGLPIGPIANPGDVAIDAAMHPADGPWLYFVTVNPDTGETVFTETVQDHERYVAQWQDWCSANPGRC